MSVSLTAFSKRRRRLAKKSYANFMKMIRESIELQEKIKNGTDLVSLARKNGYFDILAELRLLQRSRTLKPLSLADKAATNY